MAFSPFSICTDNHGPGSVCDSAISYAGHHLLMTFRVVSTGVMVTVHQGHVENC